MRTYHAPTAPLGPGKLERPFLQVDDGLGEKVEDPHFERLFTYDALGFLDTVTDAEGNMTSFDPSIR